MIDSIVNTITDFINNQLNKLSNIVITRVKLNKTLDNTFSTKRRRIDDDNTWLIKSITMLKKSITIYWKENKFVLFGCVVLGFTLGMFGLSPLTSVL